MQNSGAEGEAQVWKYVFNISGMKMVKCAVGLGLPDAVESHGQPMTLSELSLAVDCPENSLFRLMRFLNKRGIFEKQPTREGGTVYAQTPLSRLLTRRNMGSLMFGDGDNPLRSALGLKIRKGSSSGLGSNSDTGDILWSPDTWNEEGHKMVRDFFECHGRVTTSSLIKSCPEIFQGISLLVDVGGNAGTSLEMLVAAFPDMRGINFDLPHVVSGAPALDRVEHVGGDMFEAIPKADAIMLMAVLHDWSDPVCIKILKKCKESIAGNRRGKVMIVDAVLDEEEEGSEEERKDEFSEVRVAMDMAIWIATEGGKERTAKEWAKLIDAAGFTTHTINHIKAIPSLIVAYP